MNEARAALDGPYREPDEGVAAADRALAAARQGADEAGLADALALRASALVSRQRKEDVAAASAAIEEAQAIWARSGDRPTLIRAMSQRVSQICRQTVGPLRGFAIMPAKPAPIATQLRRAIALAEADTEQSGKTAAALNALGRVVLGGCRSPEEARRVFATALLIANRAGPATLEAADAVNGLGQLEQQHGRLEVAQELHETSLQLRQQLAPHSLLEAESVLQVASIAGMGALEFRLGLPLADIRKRDSFTVWSQTDPTDRGDRRAAYQKALAIREQLAPDSRLLASTLESLAQAEDDPRKAREHRERALAILRKIGSPGALQMATVLALYATREGNVAAAAEYQAIGVTIAQSQLSSKSTTAINALDFLGEDAAKRADYATARAFYERAQAAAAQFVATPFPEGRLTRLGDAARRQGDLKAARRYFQEALERYLRVDPNSLSVAGALGWLAAVADDQGDHEAAREYRRRAAAIREPLDARSKDFYAGRSSGPNRAASPGVAVEVGRLKALARVEESQGALDTARGHYQQSLETDLTLNPQSSSVAETLQKLGEIAHVRREFPAASDYLRRARTVLERVAPGSTNLADVRKTLGDVARSTGALESATVHYQAALAIRTQLQPSSVEAAAILSALGSVRRQHQDLPTARLYLRRALNMRARLAPRSLEMVSTLRELGEVELASANPTAALDFAARAWAIVRTQGSAIAGAEARQAFDARYRSIVGDLVRLQIALGRTDEAFFTVEQSRAQMLLQAATERGVVRRLASPALYDRYWLAQTAANHAGTTLEAAAQSESKARVELNAAVRQSANESSLDDKRQVVTTRERDTARARAQYTAARVQAELQWERVRDAVKAAIPRPLSAAHARASLPADTLLLVFVAAEQGCSLFVVQRDLPVQAFALALSEQQLAARVDAVRRAVSREQRVQTSVPTTGTARMVAARALYRDLVPPDAHRRLVAAKRIIVSPDGPLWELPFAALVMNADGGPQYLGLERPLTYAQSLTTFVHALGMKRQRSEPRRTVIVGNPRFDNHTPSHGQIPPPLPFAGKEAADIAAMYGAQASIGAEPTEAWFRQRVGEADIVHLATHGYFNAGRAVSSGVLLARPRQGSAPSDSDNDGVLQAWEVATQLHLNAQIVVLSACETGLGAKIPGEGLLGLTRAFQVAGAQSVIATQWRVSDLSTAKAMVTFHTHLKNGVPKDEALRLSMHAVASDRATADPFHWAPFLLVGDFSALR